MGSFSYLAFKDLIDRFLALIALLLLLPLLVLVAILLGWHLGSPVLFFQQRPGLREKPFWLVKFRTMSSAAESSGKLLADSERLTTFGRFLRNYSIDELPALINILRGDMSFIGPRPLLMDYLPLYSAVQARRHDVKPGFSGLAQINGRNTLSWEEKFRLDIYYVKNISLWLDLRIFVATIGKVLSREGVNADGEATISPFTGTTSPYE